MSEQIEHVAGANWAFGLAWNDIRRVISELEEEQLHEKAFPGANSIAGIVQHLCYSQNRLIGNKVGGEPIPENQPDRSKEFQAEHQNKASLLAMVDEAEERRQRILERLDEQSLAEPGNQWPTMTEPATKWETIQRFLTHVGHHRGQLVMLSRWLREKQAAS